MIKFLRLRNYQSWKNVLFEFHPGLNVIVGLTDSGKSGIIRSLKKIITNKPLGNSFRSWWGGDTTIRITTEKDTISRIISDKKDMYKLNTIEFTAFNKEVPIEIVQVFNFDDINLHQQQDSFFLLRNTPGEVASHFNKIANLEVIGMAQLNIKRWVSEIASEIGHEETKDKPATGLIKSIKEKKKELEKYDHLEYFESKVKDLETLELKLNSEAKIKQELNELILTIEEIQTEITEKEEILGAEPIITKLLALVEKYDGAVDKHSQLEDLIETIENQNREIEEVEKILPAGVIIDNLLSILQTKRKYEDDWKQVNLRILGIENGKKAITEAEKLYERLHKEFEKEFPDICPLCDKPK